MTKRLRVGVVIAVLTTYVALSMGAVILGNPAEFGFILPLTMAFGAAPAIGALIVLRRPDNRIGWLFCGMGLACSVAIFTLSYRYSAFRGGWAGLQQAAWAAEWTFLLFIVPGVLLFVLFPSGRLPSRRWAVPVGVAVCAAVVTGVGLAFGPATFEYELIDADTGGIIDMVIAKPYHVPDWLSPAFLAAAEVANVVLIGSACVFAVAIVFRLRRAEGIEREQLKWFVLATALIVILIPGSVLLAGPLADFGWLVSMVALGAGLPLTAGLAILRHRLYDIDVVIRRTLIYGALVGVLGMTYTALVLGLQAVLSGLTGGETLPVALSTLAIVALFGPVRTRVRAIVDRRFFRSRYDAQRTVEAFAARLRDEVDLDSLTDALRAASHSTVRPSSASVWLREVSG